MQTTDIEGYSLEFDPAATALVHAGLPLPGPEKCGCWHCRNWIAGGRDLVPHGVRALLARLGVPLNGETEIWEVPGGMLGHGYGGWYTVVGEIQRMPLDGAGHFVIDGWRLSFRPRATYAVSAFSDRPVFELHFFVDNVPSFLPEVG